MAIKLLIGGSPCTYWSIAQSPDKREVVAEGIGWELFKNYLIAKEKFKPDYFLYENNKSAAQPIKDQISRELGVDLMYINSALVSAQNRQRFYAFNWTVEQPQDRGILLKDILKTGEDLTGNDKSFCLTSTYGGAIPQNTIERNQRNMVAERISEYSCDKSRTLTASYEELSAEYYKGAKDGSLVGMTVHGEGKHRNGKQPSQQYRVYSCEGKSQVVNTFANEKYITPLVAMGTGGGNGIYEVNNGLITIKGKQYPIKLADGFYIIRKLTPIECERLQTLPDNYTKAVSNAQRYKGLGNGWTAEVIIHILNGILKDVPKDEEIIVLSLSMTASAQGDIVLTKWVLPISNITLTRLTNTLCRLLWTTTPTSYNTAMLSQSVRMIGNLLRLVQNGLTVCWEA